MYTGILRIKIFRDRFIYTCIHTHGNSTFSYLFVVCNQIISKPNAV